MSIFYNSNILNACYNKEQVIRLSQTKYPDAGPTLLADLLKEKESINLHPETIRRWLLEKKLWVANKPGSKKHRRHRERKPCYGEMVQMDSSFHRWLGYLDYDFYLCSMIDDATSRLFSRFYLTDSTETNMDLIKRYITIYGRPVSLYTDRAGHFKVNTPTKVDGILSTQNKLEVTPAPQTQIERALQECNIRIIHAGSPEAKGRVERHFATLQDRLIKRMRYEGVRNIESANEFLDGYYLPMWNEKFTQLPTSSFNAHRPSKGYDLNAIFSIQDERVVNNDYTIRFDGKRYQIETNDPQGRLKRNKVIVERRLDDSLCVRFEGRYLIIHELI
jgi:hypothetical protein